MQVLLFAGIWWLSRLTHRVAKALTLVLGMHGLITAQVAASSVVEAGKSVMC